MIDHADLEARLRAGLRAAADAIPPSGSTEPGARPSPMAAATTRERRPRRRLLLAIAAGTTAVALAGTAAVTLSRGDDDPDADLVMEPSTAATTETTEAPPGPGTTPPAGGAVVVNTDDSVVLRTFGPDGQPTGEQSLDPVIDPQAVASDRQGGWVACGLGPFDTDGSGAADTDGSDVERSQEESAASADATTGASSTVPGGSDPTVDTATGVTPTTAIAAGDEVPVAEPSPNVYHFRPGEDPELINAQAVCMAGSLKVTDLGDHQVLVYQTFSGLRQLDLTTGVDAPVSVDTSTAIGGQWSVGGGRLATHGPAGLQVWDLATGEPVPVGPADLPVRAPDATSGLLTSDLALSPDGTMLATMVGDIVNDSDVVVIDLASGGERFRRTVPMSLEGVEVAFDGTSVAVGNYYDMYGPTRIYDVATGAERTVDAHGLLP